jgi:acetoin utilization deacetylase AcuC-like enzyme
MKFVYDGRCEAHVQWPGHPERPERVKAIVGTLTREVPTRAFIAPPAATKRDVMRVHDEAFVERMRQAKEGPYDADTFIHEGTYALALLAAGTALAGAREAARGAEEVFALTRPPGHHAGADFAGGFCYFNNAAIAADYLSREEGLSPVAIVDLDVHHGNGTQAIFNKRRDIVYLSTHQWGIFPGTGAADEVGEGKGRGHIVNVPLPAGSGDRTFEVAWERVLLPVLEEAAPKAVVVSLGLDAHFDDPLAGLSLSSPGYIDMCAKVAEFASRRARAKVLFVLEGGYNLAALAETVAGLAAKLEGRAFKTALNQVQDADGVGASAVEEAAKVQRAHWALKV